MNLVIDQEFKDRIPPLKLEEYTDLESNILKRGECRDPLSIWNGILVDGHNRYEICQKHGIKFSTIEVDGCNTRPDVLLWMDRNQLGRRNISDDQRAVIADRVVAAESKKAMTERGETARAAVKKRNPVKSDLEDTATSKSEPKQRTRKAVAEKLRLSERKLRASRYITLNGGDDAEAIKALIIASKITLNDGKKLAGLPEDKRPDAVLAVQSGTDVRTAVREAKKESYNARIALAKPKRLEGTYRILYIDPPWKYHGLNQADEYGHAEAHYKCLDDQQLIDFKPDDKRLIKDLADDNAILFMWVTAPLLERSFPILNAWGFKYKANFVWHKIDHVMGFYNSVRHEHLLIATRGSCTPDVKKLYNSVQSIKRREHSRKPTEFYEIIEKLYDHGRKLEIFARSEREGWDSVGNEVFEVESIA